MDLITYISASVIAYLGLVSGLLLAYSNLDELKPGRKYFILIQKMILAAIIILAFCMLPAFNSVLLSVLAFAVATFVFFAELPLAVTYFVLGAAFYLSSINNSSFAAMAALIFLFGIPSGTLSNSTEQGKLKSNFKELAYCLGFFICIILFLL